MMRVMQNLLVGEQIVSLLVFYIPPGWKTGSQSVIVITSGIATFKNIYQIQPTLPHCLARPTYFFFPVLILDLLIVIDPNKYGVQFGIKCVS